MRSDQYRRALRNCLTIVLLMSVCIGSASILVHPSCPPASLSEPNQEGDYVVLLHGMGRSPRSMRRMGKILKTHGYQVINEGYPSTEKPISELVGVLANTVDKNCSDKTKAVHFVTHSLGGILVRIYLGGDPEINLGRVVMLGPPNAGSEIADVLKNNPIYRAAVGPAGQQLTTGSGDLPKSLGPVNFELGVIAGNVSLNPIYSSFINGESDGKVSVASARISGMSDFMVMHTSHTFMMQRKKVIKQVVNFLQTGQFKGQEKTAAQRIHTAMLPRPASDSSVIASGQRDK